MSELTEYLLERTGLMKECEEEIRRFLEREKFKSIKKKDWGKYDWIDFDEVAYDECGDPVLPIDYEGRILDKTATEDAIYDEISPVRLVEQEIEEVEYRIEVMSDEVLGNLGVELHALLDEDYKEELTGDEDTT